MSVRRAVRQQYGTIVDAASRQVAHLHTPREGWLRAMRKALGMSGAQLARRMGVTRARISNAEQAEQSGGITIKSMQAAAEAMGCRFVYAIVPPDGTEALITAQARKKAMAVVSLASRHMALEGQALPDEKIAREVDRVAADLARAMPTALWDDT